MYNTTLLEEFEDDATGSPESQTKFEVAENELIEEEDEDEGDGAIEDSSAEPALGVSSSEDLLLDDGSESWSDDPVRMYLTQMGEIPLLTRQQEISLARRIEVTRVKFRAKLLQCDYVLRSAVKVLRRVHDGELPFDRTVQVSVTDSLEKDQILGRLPKNLATVELLLKSNRRDYFIAVSKSKKLTERKAAWKRLGRRRNRAVKLVEELGLRTQRVETMMCGIHERFVDTCRRSGEQMIPALRWETRYSRVAGECVPEAEILNI